MKRVTRRHEETRHPISATRGKSCQHTAAILKSPQDRPKRFRWLFWHIFHGEPPKSRWNFALKCICSNVYMCMYFCSYPRDQYATWTLHTGPGLHFLITGGYVGLGDTVIWLSNSSKHQNMEPNAMWMNSWINTVIVGLFGLSFNFLICLNVSVENFSPIPFPKKTRPSNIWICGQPAVQCPHDFGLPRCYQHFCLSMIFSGFLPRAQPLHVGG